MTVPAGLILLVGPPAAGKSSFASAWIGCGEIDVGGVVSCDAIRAQLFGPEVRVADDPAVFSEMDSRVVTRLAAGRSVVVDATNVMRAARTRMVAWARERTCPVTALRFNVEADVLSRRNVARVGHARVPAEDVSRYAALAETSASHEQLLGEGIDVVLDVPGEAEGVGSTEAAQRFRIEGRR